MVQNKVEAAYARSDLFDRRRRLMDEWAVQDRVQHLQVRLLYLAGRRGPEDSRR